jgi:diguanylate cyclase (GGDEF)-like protein
MVAPAGKKSSASSKRKTDQRVSPLYLKEEVSLLDLRAKGLEFLSVMTDTVYQERDFFGVIGQAADQILKLTQFRSVAIYGMDDKTGKLDLLKQSGVAQENLRTASRLMLSDSFTQIAVNRKQVVYSFELDQDDRLSHQMIVTLEKEGSDCTVAIPMLINDQVYGVINLIYAPLRTLTEDEHWVMLSLAKSVGLAFINARHLIRIEHEMRRRERAEVKLKEINEALELAVQQKTHELAKSNELLRQANEELHQQIRRRQLESLTDPVSGLYTTSYFDVRLQADVQHAKRYHRALSLLLLDMDHFSGINARIGHASAEQLIGEVGRVIRQSIRVVDSAFRYTGNQFVILLPEVILQDAFIVGERIRGEVAELQVEMLDVAQADPLKVSISIGAVEYGREDDTIMLLERARLALLQAKSSGRNRVVSLLAPRC